jgi:N-methylhydantoinase B
VTDPHQLRAEASTGPAAGDERADAVPIELQVVGSSLRAVTEEMGAVLIRAAFSTNIKERRDCSTALFDGRGQMVAQAEHIPVHLGAMPDAVAAVVARDPAPGELWLVNDPFTGGTHLPDLTLVSRTALGFAATRAHHADVGGMEPASLPAGSRDLFQEGLVVPPVRLTDDVRAIVLANTRNPEERQGDLRAQEAAHRLAEQRVAALVARHGSARLAAAMEELLAYSERVVRAGVSALPDGRYEGEDVVEAAEGLLPIRVAVTVAGSEITFSFDGTAAQHAGNLNCPLSVTRSACAYVVRCLAAPDVPASGGAFAPMTVRAPEGCLVNARAPAAVVAGNTETASRIVDVVWRALAAATDVPAQGQGTMNNVALGGAGWTYYETIGGGQGACPHADGPSGVHVAMSNTLNTPAEALELQLPLRVRRHELRLGSGGVGTHRGGDGVVRELEALEPCRVSLLTERRAVAPAGERGGRDGQPGRNLVNGEELPAKATRELAPGDVLRVETPGGGGWGGAEPAE